MKYNNTYLAGSFYDWRDRVKKSLPSISFVDPRQTSQHCIADLVSNDMSAAGMCRRMLVGLPKDKGLPTMTYAEVGAAKCAGNTIVVVDENEKKEPLMARLADRSFSDFDSAVRHLRRAAYPRPADWEHKEHDERPDWMENGDKREVKRVLVQGIDVNLGLEASGKKTIQYYNLSKLPEFGKHIDLMVVGFERGKRDRRHITLMGAAYGSEIPIIMVEANPIIYPPLAGLARRIFTGPQRMSILADYLRELKSNDINQEAKAMYELFKKYNS